MKRQFTSIVAGLLLFASFHVHAGPEEDRLAMIEFFKKMFPNVQLEDYGLGALALNPEAKEQYDEMMAFPPFAADVRKGGLHWETPFKNGEKFASCFKHGGAHAAANYPYFDDSANRVVTFENAINDCLKTNNEKEIPYGSKEMALLTIHARSLSDGAKFRIKVKGPAALAAYEKGKQMFYERRGQLNFSCAACHVDYAGYFLRNDQLSMLTGHATHWPLFRAGTEVVTFQGRFIQCQKLLRAKPHEYNSTEFNNLEYYMTYMSNGLKLLSPVFRK